MRRGAPLLLGRSAGPPTYVGAGPSVSEIYSSPITLSRPTAQAGDQLFAVIGGAQLQYMSPPSGWALVGSVVPTSGTNSLQVYQKQMGASEPTSFSWPWIGGGTEPSGFIIAYRNLAPSPVRSAAGVDLASTATMRFPSVMANAGDVLLGVGWCEASGPLSATGPSGLTERVDRHDGDATFHYAADLIGTTSGATGNRDATLSKSVSRTFGISLALIPA